MDGELPCADDANIFFLKRDINELEHKILTEIFKKINAFVMEL